LARRWFSGKRGKLETIERRKKRKEKKRKEKKRKEKNYPIELAPK